jgi:hypothetical protein
MRGDDSMHEVGPFIGALRRRLRRVLPHDWLAPNPVPGSGTRARKPTRARMELDAEAPATSWVAWEISRGGRRGG